MSKNELKVARLEHANQLIRLIASHGRKFFSHKDRIAELSLDQRGRIWLCDDYTGQLIYTHYSGRWREFSHGGTMRDFIVILRDYIQYGKQLPLGIICYERRGMHDGNVWGYDPDEAMKLRDACKGLPLFIPNAAE